MQHKLASSLLLLLTVVVAARSEAEPPSFTIFDSVTSNSLLEPGGALVISADAETVAGTKHPYGGWGAARATIWQNGEVDQYLGVLSGDGFSYATGVSGDGGRVVGVSTQAPPAGDHQAFVWSAGAGMVGLGDLDGGAFRSIAHGVSADGSTVVGQGTDAASKLAFRWTDSGGMIALGDLAGGTLESIATATSADGSVVVGTGHSALGQEAFLWRASTGMVGLGDLPGGQFESTAYGVSDDGSTVVGQARTNRSIAYRWTETGGMQSLGGLEGGPALRGSAYDASADGAVIVGFTQGDDGDEAFVWNEAHGMQALETVLTTLSVDLQGWQLISADSISADGRTIVGRAEQNYTYTSFIAVIPEPSTGTLLGVGLAGLAVRRRRR